MKVNFKKNVVKHYSVSLSVKLHKVSLTSVNKEIQINSYFMVFMMHLNEVKNSISLHRPGNGTNFIVYVYMKEHIFEMRRKI